MPKYNSIKKENCRSIIVVGNGSIGVAEKNRLFISNHTGDLLRQLKSRGYTPTYMAPASLYDSNSDLLNFDLNQYGIRSSVLNKSNLFGLVRVLCSEIWKTRFIYIFYPGTIGMIVALLCLLFRKPYGLYVRGGRYNQGWLSRLIIRSASFILTVSPSIENELQFYCKNILTIRPMTSIEESDRLNRPVMQVAPSYWRGLFVGNLCASKGIRELIDAAKILHQEQFPFQLTLVGGGELYEELSKWLPSSPLSRNIKLAGLISNKNKLMSEYKKADFFILPTYHEGFPRVLYEAMINSLPIITTMVGGIPGRMENEKNCIAIDVKSSAAIVSAIKQLAGDLTLYNTIGRDGQKTVLNVLSMSRGHDDLLCSFLEELVC
jgi:glycosyltransferase involved in cell wall biosynthesis